MDVTFKGEAVKTVGEPPVVGDQFPDFTVTDKDGNKVALADLLDKPLLISVVPNINTSVCSIQTKKFNNDVDGYTDVNFVTISTNTVEEQSHWCAAEGVKNMKMLSDEKHDFGKNTGLLIDAMGILGRSVWVVDTNKAILYSEILEEETNEPNYDNALAELNKLN